MTQRSLKHLQRLVVGAAILFVALAVSSGIWASAAHADPSPSQTPSASPTPGMSGLYMFTAEAGFQYALRQINTTNGDASLPFPSTTTNLLAGVAQNPATGVVWALRQDCRLYTVNMSTGALTAATPVAVTLPSPYTVCESLAIDADGVFYVAMSDVSVTPHVMTWGTIDSGTGVATVRWNPLSPPERVSSMSFDPATGSVYYYASRGNSPTYYGWFEIPFPSTTLSTSSTITDSALAFSPQGVAFNDVVDRASNVTNFLINNVTFVGYPNSQSAFHNTLFWYVAPATPTVTPAALAATGSSAIVPAIISAGTAILGCIAISIALMLRRRAQYRP